MSLVIVESPGKCKTIQGYLGHGWRVMASMGHLRALVPALDSVGITKQFEPTYEWIKEKAATIKALKEAAKEATEIYVAADDDREGEFIAYSVCLLLKLNPKTAKRAVFHEITETAIQHAIHHPRHMDMNRVHAQQARSMLDMMIGFTISPLLWKYVAPSLSAGRCQTPALRLVVEREDAIQSFQATSSWKLTAMMRPLSSSSSPPFGMTMDDELEDEESAQNYLELVHATPQATVLHTATKPWTESAPDPLMTSTLQQQASALFHMNPQSTMRIAQSLYEAGHITYMRTDQAVLSEDVKQEAREWVTTNVGPTYLSGDTSHASQTHTPLPWKESVAAGDLKVSSAGLKGASGGAKREGCGDTPAKGGQCVSAHEAIRPTHITTLQAGKDAQEQKIYRLIWQRTVQSIMSSARGETDHMTCQIDDEFRWSTSWRRTIHEGWKRIGQVANLDQEDEKEEKEKVVPRLVPGDRLEWTTMKAEPKETKAQGRYTEAQLVRALETHGIGRPSTFASLLSIIQEKKYVECVDLPPRPVPVKEWSLIPHQWPPTVTALVKQLGAEKKKMVPTPLGRAVLHFLLTHMEDLFAYTFTARMERRLDAIAEGAEDVAMLLADTWRSYQDRYEGLLQGQKSQQVPLGQSQGQQDHVKRRTFSEGLLAVQTKKGPLLLKEGTKADTVFYGWPKKATWDSLTDEEAHAFVKRHQEEKMGQGEEMGEWKGTPMIRKKGKFGEYVQWGTVSVSLVQGESLEALQARLEAKEAGGSAVLATFASYVIRNGPYGPYIMKTSVQKKQYVSLPKGVDPAALTEKEVAALYQLGLQSKKKRPS